MVAEALIELHLPACGGEFAVGEHGCGQACSAVGRRSWRGQREAGGKAWGRGVCGVGTLAAFLISPKSLRSLMVLALEGAAAWPFRCLPRSPLVSSTLRARGPCAGREGERGRGGKGGGGEREIEREREKE